MFKVVQSKTFPEKNVICKNYGLAIAMLNNVDVSIFLM